MPRPEPAPEKNEQKRRLPPGLARLAARTDTAEDRLRGFLWRARLPVFLLAVTALAAAARVALWPFVSGDYVECLDPWMNEIRAAAGFHSLHLQIGNYTAPYHYLMAAMSYIPGLENLLAIKIPSAIADFCMAAAGALLVWRLTQSRLRAAMAYAALLCLPTVWLNSAAWGQCDAMYTTLVLLFFAGWLGGHRALGTLCYGLALAVKLQAVFVLPVLVIFWLCGRLRLRHLLAGAAGYVLPFVPAMVASGGLSPLWRAYSMQARVNALSSNIANGASLFTGFAGEELAMLAPALMCVCFAALGALALYCWQHRGALDARAALRVLALCALLAPWLLPAMKDRYFYMAEVLCLLYALATPRRFWMPLALQFASLPAYVWYLTGTENPFGRWLVLASAAPVYGLLRDLRAGFATGGNIGGDS